MSEFLDHESDADPDDFATHSSAQTPMEELIARRLDRRQALAGFAAAFGAMALAGSASAQAKPSSGAGADSSTLDFQGLSNTIEATHRVAEGYDAKVLIRWGDPVLGGAPAFDAHALKGADQSKQFGYNNDFLAYVPLPFGSANSDHGLLWANHEYTSASLMWSRAAHEAKLEGLSEAERRAANEAFALERAAVQMAAHGGSLVEVKRSDGEWRVVEGSRYARRVLPTTPMQISGPAAGHARMKTSADPTGRKVFGMLNNCAGGMTPWGTILTAEENVQSYFQGDADQAGPERVNHKRMGMGKDRFGFALLDERFDFDRHPHEPNRFGWIVEIDPYDPNATPIKRTALGRFKHEGAGVHVNPDGRVVCYCGDDQQFEYLYKFVSHGRYDPNDREANRDLLDSGTLFVAQFGEEEVRWLPLVFGSGPLTSENGFHDQGEVLIEARRAATLLGATPMDRPEDVEVSPATGKVYAMLTNNGKRKLTQVDAVNPRAKNRHGHVLEMTPPDRGQGPDHGALRFRWELLLRGGNPEDLSHGAAYHPAVGPNDWLSCPDNVAIDPRGRVWIATDQGSSGVRNGLPDGLRACDAEGEGRALTRLFFAAPIGAELCGPCFTPDAKTLFVAVQHPGAGPHPDGETASSFDHPNTRWPDFDEAGKVPPRPSVVAIQSRNGGPIGG